MLLARLFIVVFISFRCAGHDTEGSYHTNVWVVEVPAGEERANEIAQRLGFINHGKVKEKLYVIVVVLTVFPK